MHGVQPDDYEQEQWSPRLEDLKRGEGVKVLYAGSSCRPNAIYLELGDAFAQFRISSQATAPAIRRAQSFRSVAGHIAMPGPRYLARPRWRALRRLRPPRCFEMAWSCQEHPVGRASDPSRPQVEDMRVDHRGTDVAVTEELLDGADVVVVL